MKILNNSILEVKKGDNEYGFHCAGNSPLGEVYDVLSEMRNYVGGRLVEQMKQEEAAKTKVETPCPSPTP